VGGLLDFGAVWSSRTQSRAGVAEQLPYRFITIAGFFLLFGVRPGRSDGYLVFWTYRTGQLDHDGLTGVGFAFAWWARLHLGNSGPPLSSAKQSTGSSIPPIWDCASSIYSGIILAAVAVAILKANLYAIIGALLIITVLDQSTFGGTFPQPATRPRNLRRLSASGADAFSKLLR